MLQSASLEHSGAKPLTRDPPHRARQLALVVQVVFVIMLALTTGISTGWPGATPAGSPLLLVALVAFSGACIASLQGLTGTRRAVFLGLLAFAVCSALAQLHISVRYVMLGEVPVFPSPALLLLILGAHPCLIIGLTAALGWKRSEIRFALVLDALLLVAAAAVVGIQLTYLADWPVHELSNSGKALIILWRCMPIAELALVVLLLSSRGEALGLRTSLGLGLGVLAFAMANILHGRPHLFTAETIVSSTDLLWALSLVAFTIAQGAHPTPREERDGMRTSRAVRSRLRASFTVAAIFVAAGATLVIGFREQGSPELAVAVATFGALLAVRGGHALLLQQRTSERLASSVAAERALSTTLEMRVDERTRELAEAERVLQRMWALGQHVTQELYPGRVVERFMEAVSDIAKVDGAALALRIDGNTLTLRSMLGVGAGMEGQTVYVNGTAMGHVVRLGKSWCVTDMREDRETNGFYSVFEGLARGMAVVPINRRGACIGALTLVTRRPRSWSADELSRIEAMTDLLSVALANAEAMDELRRAEWRFRTLFRAAPDMVVTVLSSGRVVEANDCVRDVIGLEPSAVIGRQLGEFVVAEDRARLDAAVAAAFSGHGDRLDVQVARDGGSRQVAIALSRLAETDPPTVLLIARDITSERDMRARLVETERLAAVGELVAGVAHEVNNPLSSISAFAQLLLRDGTLHTEQRESVEVIHTETLRAAQVVKDLLAFARRSEPRRAMVDLNQVVERTLRLRGYQLSASNVRVDLDLPPELPPVLGDARQLQQVVLNLVTNSIQAMEGSAEGVLHLRTRSDEANVILEITDSGAGIPAVARSHVFEPFFTTKEEGEGTGLGLSVSYGIVAAHGGSLVLADTSRRGTRFEITLPAAAADQCADTFQEDEAPPPPRSPLAGMRVLFVDDEATLRQGMEAFGRQRGFTVVTAADGKGALAAVGTTSFDALVCDVRMPEMDGWALHDAIRKIRPGLAERTVFVTGDVLASNHRNFTAGRPTVVTKPFRFEHLEETVSAVLRLHGVRVVETGRRGHAAARDQATAGGHPHRAIRPPAPLT